MVRAPLIGLDILSQILMSVMRPKALQRATRRGVILPLRAYCVLVLEEIVAWPRTQFEFQRSCLTRIARFLRCHQPTGSSCYGFSIISREHLSWVPSPGPNVSRLKP